METFKSSLHQNKIDIATLQQHTKIKLSFLQDVKNNINDKELTERISKIIDEVESITAQCADNK